MDILRFVNSKAIREHLKKINYKFNTLEAAYLIYFCRSLTFEERHKAWKELINTMPDMAPAEYFDKHWWEPYGDSIHSCLKQHMENEREILDEFLKIKNGAFFVRMYDKYDKDYDIYVYPRFEYLMTNIDDTYDFINKFIKDDDEDVVHSYTICCQPNDSRKQFYVTFNRDGDALTVEVAAEHQDKPSLDILLETMWFAFPTPFKRGDIVIDNQRPESSQLWSGPFVFDETAAEWLTRRGKKGHDYTDMTANGWFQNEDGTIYGECMHDYMSLEYYPIKKIEGVQKVLLALSNRIKGEIDEELFANAYHSILLEEYVKRVRPYWITDEGLKFEGLKE